MRVMQLARATLFSAMLVAGPTVAPAFDIGAMSDAEREAFQAEIRAYILDNPEVLVEAFNRLEAREAEAQALADAAAVAAAADALHNDGVSWEGGNPDGDITLVEFLDYKCGYCRQAFPEVEELVASDGNIRIIVKEFPILGQESLLASRFAIATRNVAGPEAYKEVHDTFFTMRGSVSDAALDRIAGDLDLDIEAIRAAMEAPEVRDELLANRALAEQLQINGTPAFVLGDELLRGYLPLGAMQQLVAEMRSE